MREGNRAKAESNPSRFIVTAPNPTLVVTIGEQQPQSPRTQSELVMDGVRQRGNQRINSLAFKNLHLIVRFNTGRAITTSPASIVSSSKVDLAAFTAKLHTLAEK